WALKTGHRRSPSRSDGESFSFSVVRQKECDDDGPCQGITVTEPGSYRTVNHFPPTRMEPVRLGEAGGGSEAKRISRRAGSRSTDRIRRRRARSSRCLFQTRGSLCRPSAHLFQCDRAPAIATRLCRQTVSHEAHAGRSDPPVTARKTSR